MTASAAGGIVNISVVITRRSNLQPNNVIAVHAPVFLHLQRTHTNEDYLIKQLLLTRYCRAEMYAIRVTCCPGESH